MKRSSKRKKLVTIVILMLTCLMLTSCKGDSNSSDVSSYESSTHNLKVIDVTDSLYINDFVNIFSEEEKSDIMIPNAKQDTYLTIEEDSGELVIRKKKENNGVLLLIFNENTEVHLEIGKEIQEIIESNSGKILDNFFVLYRDENNHNEEGKQTVQVDINYLADSGEYEISIADVDSEELSLAAQFFRFALCVIVIILFILLLEFLTGHFWGNGFGQGILYIISEIFWGNSSSEG